MNRARRSSVACAVIDDGAGGGQLRSGVDRLSFSYHSDRTASVKKLTSDRVNMLSRFFFEQEKGLARGPGGRQ